MKGLNHDIRNAVVNLFADIKHLPHGYQAHAKSQLKRIEDAMRLVNGMFLVKDLDVMNLHPVLKEIVEAVKSHWGLDIITSELRPGDAGCHGTTCAEGKLRAVDLRLRDDVLGPKIEAWVNAHWQYDPKRPHKPVAWYHESEPGADDWHLHTQVHPNTTRKTLKNTSGRFPQ